MTSAASSISSVAPSATSLALPGAAPVVVVGGGPAGLMAAEVLASDGVAVHLYDAMPSVGRKFLLAGKGGLNLTHSEPHEPFMGRYAEARAALEPAMHDWGGPELRGWAAGLGIETFVCSSWRVFPTDMKAAPLLRAWLHRLRGLGVQFHMRHRWLGWDASGGLLLQGPQGPVTVAARAVVLALGGASWARLGSDGAWVPWLQARGVAVAPLRPSNCGFEVAATARERGESRREFLGELLGHEAAHKTGWTSFFAERFAGQPFKSVALRHVDGEGRVFERRATFELDLLPDHSAERVLAEVRHPRGSRSLSSHLKGRLGLDGIKMGVLNELLSREQMNDPTQLAAAIKGLPITVVATRPLDEAISTAGGVAFEGLDADLMLRACPGVFCAGEMLDWEAPTGGYLLTACAATGRQAGQGVLRWLAAQSA